MDLNELAKTLPRMKAQAAAFERAEKGKAFESEVHAFLVRADDAVDNEALGSHTKFFTIADGVLIWPSETYTRSEAGYKCGCEVCLNCKIAKAMRMDMKTFYDCTLEQAFERYPGYFKSVGLTSVELSNNIFPIKQLMAKKPSESPADICRALEFDRKVFSNLVLLLREKNLLDNADVTLLESILMEKKGSIFEDARYSKKTQIIGSSCEKSR